MGSQAARYQRQVVLPGIGPGGQEKLRRARVLLVGVGGLGSPVSLYLAAAGVGSLTLVDPDVVEESNLQRQVLYVTADQGRAKAELAARRLKELNPEVRIEACVKRVEASDLAEHDLVIDAVDNFETRFLLNDAAVQAGVPLVHGSISKWEGRVSVFWPPHGPCLRCLYPAPPATFKPSGAELGVLGATAGVVGSVMALQAVLALVSGARAPGLLLGRVLVIDTASMGTMDLGLERKVGCRGCGNC